MRKKTNTRWAWLGILLILTMLLGPVTMYGKAPAGYLDPVEDLGLREGDIDSYMTFLEELEAIYLVPYEAQVAVFDSYLDRAEGTRFFPVGGAPLILKRGEVTGEYSVDISYGPVEYTIDNSLYRSQSSGSLILKNIQFGTTQAQGILYNAASDGQVFSQDGSNRDTYQLEVTESRGSASADTLPEASYLSAIAFDRNQPGRMMVAAKGVKVNGPGSELTQVIVHFRVEGVKTAQSTGGLFGGFSVETQAEKEPGEWDLSIPAVLVSIIIGGGAALAGAGAGGSGSGEHRKTSRFVMRMKKDFGDGLRRGGQAQPVYARMVEITSSGEEIPRPDLTEKITFSTDDVLEISDSGSQGDYHFARVLAPKEETGPVKTQGVLSIQFTAQEGSLTNHVSFRLMGQPFIVFPEMPSYAGTMVLDMIWGDGVTYEMAFETRDFSQKPEVTVVGQLEGLEAKVEHLEGDRWQLVLMNGTSKVPEKGYYEWALQAKHQEESSEVSFGLRLYPEGLSLEGEMDQEGRLVVETDQNKEAGDLDSLIRPTPMTFVLALVDRKGDQPKALIADPAQIEMVFSPLQAREEQSQSLPQTFAYRINADRGDRGIYSFEPEVTLPEGPQPFVLSLPVEAIYEGEHYPREIQVRLKGEVPEGLSPWKQEQAYLKRAIQRYGLSANDHARDLIKTADKRSATELFLIRRAIIEEAMYYYTREGEAFKSLDAKMGQMEFVFKTMKWFGDQAISYLAKAYAGGDLGEAFVVPLKDYTLELVGELGAQMYWGEEIHYPEVSFLMTLENGVENALIALILGEKRPTPKVLGTLAASLVMLNFSRYYGFTEDSKGDFYKTLVKMGSDFTVTGLKTLVGKYFDKFLKTRPDFSKSVNQYVEKYVRNSLKKMDSFELLRKYLEESLGLVFQETYDRLAAEAGGLPVEEDWHFSFSGSTFVIASQGKTLSLDLLANAGGLAELFFKEFLANAGLPQTPAAMPVEPPYYR